MAEFVMRGRSQALLVVVAGIVFGGLLFSWVSAAALSLVTLRKGAVAGSWLFLWALLPAGALLYSTGDMVPLVLLTGAMVLALVLRETVNLPLAVLTAVGVGVATGLALMALFGGYLEQGAADFAKLMESFEQQLSKDGQAVELPRLVAPQIAGMLGAGAAMMSVLCLLLARYWQAALYNPGGFGEEFRALYYPPMVSGVLVLAAVGLASLGLHFRTWATICVIPLTFAGLALVHARVRLSQRGRGWLTWFYLAWVLFDPVKLLVVFFAVADSWLKFRQRWSKGSKTQLGQPDEHDEKGDRDM